MLDTCTRKARIALLCSVLSVVILGGIAEARPARARDEKVPYARAVGFSPAGAQTASNYPADPTGDFDWNTPTLAGIADVQSAFDQARANENSQLGTSLPPITLPTQAQWNGMSDGAKATWLINRERSDRGVMRMQGEESHVTAVANTFAQYLLSHDVFDHNADGRDPWQRLDADATIGACHDNLNVAENLSVFVTTGSSIPLGLERAIYMWLYVDSGSSWGHRQTVLWYPYNDNSGPSGKEGFLGIGRVRGGPYQGPFTRSYPLAEITVLNVFDPCAAWNYKLAGAFSLFLPLVKR